MTALGEFHHVGYACTDIDTAAAGFAPLGYAPEGARFTDATQRITGLFLVGGGPRIELLEPAGDDSPIRGFLAKGQRMYHLAYLVDDMAATLGRLRDLRAKVVVPPVPAVAFDGRRIAFAMMPTLDLVEVIER